MGLFSKKSSMPPLKKLGKGKQLEKRVAGIEDDEYNDDVPDNSDHVSEFKEGIDEIKELFMDESESGGDKFGKLSFGLANLSNYRNVVFENLVGNGMSETKADQKIKHILIDAGFIDMMLDIVSFREEKKRGRKKKVR
jgi:hypothetical protein